jgi:hypothetical protein
MYKHHSGSREPTDAAPAVGLAYLSGGLLSRFCSLKIEALCSTETFIFTY